MRWLAAATLARMRTERNARGPASVWVPQEREVFPSLTVDENLTVTAQARTVDDGSSVHALFPRLAERRVATSATSCRAASSRCWRWAAR